MSRGFRRGRLRVRRGRRRGNPMRRGMRVLRLPDGARRIVGPYAPGPPSVYLVPGAWIDELVRLFPGCRFADEDIMVAWTRARRLESPIGPIMHSREGNTPDCADLH